MKAHIVELAGGLRRDLDHLRGVRFGMLFGLPIGCLLALVLLGAEWL